MLDVIVKVANIKLRVPTEADLLDVGITRDMVRAKWKHQSCLCCCYY